MDNLDIETKKVLSHPPIHPGLMDTPLNPTETFLVFIVYVCIPLMLVLCTCIVCAIPWYPRQTRVPQEDLYAGYLTV